MFVNLIIKIVKQIAIISDTHSFFNQKMIEFIKDCDEIWHAGDIGNEEVASKLEDLKPVRAVWGNIDGGKLRIWYKENELFIIEGLKVWLTHIGGYPGKYNPKIRSLVYEKKPDLFICGHSHIVKVMRDKKVSNLLHINPGAAGKVGFHKVRTMVKFNINDKKIENLQVIELGKRA